MVINVEDKSNIGQEATKFRSENLSSSSETFDFFNSIISLSELPNFVSIILSLRFSFLSLIFSFLRKAADWTSFITFSNSKAGLLTKLDIGEKKSVKKEDKFLRAIKSNLPTNIRIKQIKINNELNNLFLYNLLFSKSILRIYNH